MPRVAVCVSAMRLMQRWPLFCAVGLAFRPNRLPHFSRRAVQVSATEKQESAVAAFKMITEDESKVRKAAGVGVFLPRPDESGEAHLSIEFSHYAPLDAHAEQQRLLELRGY